MAGRSRVWRFNDISVYNYITVYNISCNQFQLVVVMQKTGMDRSIPVLVRSLPDAHFEGLVLVLVATI